MKEGKARFKRLIAIASRPLLKEAAKWHLSDGYNAKPARSRKAASAASTHSDESPPKRASKGPKNPR